MQGVPTKPAVSVAEQISDPTVVTRTLKDIIEEGKTITKVELIKVVNGAHSLTFNRLTGAIEDLQLPLHPTATLGDLLALVNRMIAEVNASSHIEAKLTN